jgi:archaeal flagellin FlaB
MKKAEMGVGTLIIFIAMLLVAAVAAGVLLQTAGSLQEKSLATGKQATGQIATNAETVEVSATDGRDGNLNEFNQIMKLSPGSDEIKLDQIIFSFNTKDATSTLKYRGTTGTCINNGTTGYTTRINDEISSAIDNNSWYSFTEDIDYDGDFSDRMRVAANGDALEFDLSSFSSYYNFSITDVSNAENSPVSFSVEKQNIHSTNASYGKIAITGTTNVNDSLIADMITIYPYKNGEGYFTVTYLQTGTNHVAGNMQRGDLIKICYEAPNDIGEDEEVRLNFIPKIGTATLTEFVTPDVISTQRTYLYP